MSKINHKVCAGRPLSWPKTTILILIKSTNSHIPFEKHGSRLNEVSSQNCWPKLKIYPRISLISAQNHQNLAFSNKKSLNLNFSSGTATQKC